MHCDICRLDVPSPGDPEDACPTDQTDHRTEQEKRTHEQKRPNAPEINASLLIARQATAVAIDRLRCFDYKAYLARTHVEGIHASSLRAWLANPANRGPVIVELTHPMRHSIYSQASINGEFHKYYAALYTSKVHPTEGEIRTFLSHFPLPTVSQQEAAELGAAITIAEVRAAIASMAHNKTTGPDGIHLKVGSATVYEEARVC
ncbi:hypothetical protein NDU88_005811 [Pleurodeles waltl]|uniref:Uncharacterized protein n=1 Tax=Pleurodeles waltl TaxID=8319 RepID=A0AAV7VPA0_PLEWA|nr:hypothetical protein NDU88_005811 [Pleurodeles waltl]